MLEVQYATRILEIIEDVKVSQTESIVQAAKLIAETIKNDGLLHLFGCGHSHILVEEVFYRAGGIVPVNPMFESSAMLHEGAVKSSKVEKMQGYAEHILNNYEVREGEVIILFSTSGINSLPIEMAIEAKKRGLKIIAFTSSSYLGQASRHPSGKRLSDLADIVIDNKQPYGDALVEVPGTEIKMSSGSTVVGSFLLNMVMARTVEELQQIGVEPPIFKSGNIEGGAEYNQRYIQKYKSRIKHL